MKATSTTISRTEQPDPSRRRSSLRNALLWSATAAVIVSIAVHTWVRYRADQQRSLAAQLAATIVKERDPSKMLQAVNDGQLSKDQAMDAQLLAIETDMQRRMDGYFATPERDRNRYLDAMIDEMQKLRADVTGKLAEARKSGTDPQGLLQPGDRNFQARMQERMNNLPPDQRTQRAEFMAAMRRRMIARGFEAMFPR